MNSLKKLIRKYFYEGYKYEDMLLMLEKDGFPLSLSTLKRMLRELKLKRKLVIEDIEGAIFAILIEIEGSGSCLGYKSMWDRLKQKYELRIKRSTVLDLMHIIDPDGIDDRSRYRLKRRLYKTPGSDFIWHLDGIYLFIYITMKFKLTGYL